MIIFIYDGSVVGLLSCIFFSYSNKIKPDFIYTDAVQYTMCDITYDIASDEIKAERVERKLKTICGNGIIKTLTDALRYKDETKRLRNNRHKLFVKGKFHKRKIERFYIYARQNLF